MIQEKKIKQKSRAIVPLIPSRISLVFLEWVNCTSNTAGPIQYISDNVKFNIGIKRHFILYRGLQNINLMT